MATTAKIAKQDSRLAALAHAKETKTMVKFPTRLRNRCKQCGRPPRILAKVPALPDLLPEVCARGRNSGRDQG